MAKYFHIMTDPYAVYLSLDEAVEGMYAGVNPYIPLSAGPTEDTSIPRVCLAPSVELCLTSIGFSLGPHNRRPIIIGEFELDDTEIVKPTREQVPDVDYTKEVWALSTVVPEKVYVKYISKDSIVWEKITMDDGVPLMYCVSVSLEEEHRSLLKRMNLS